MSSARERVLQAAEELFSTHGYTAVTLRDIAGRLGMRVASLYNHAPGGKEQLFIDVTERGLQRHRAGITAALAQAPGDVRAQLAAVGQWLLAQPPVNLSRMRHSDLPALAPEQRRRLGLLAYESLLVPLQDAVGQAVARGELDGRRAVILAGMFITAVEAFRDLTPHTGIPQDQALEHVIDLLLEGARPRGA